MVPRYVLPLARDKSPLRLPRRWSVLLPELFFNGWPASFIPVGDGGFIALRCSLDGLLSTPSCLAQQATYMITMILHTECPSDHLGNTPCSPDVSAEAIRLGPKRSKLRYLYFLLLCQARLHSVRRMRVKRLHSLLSPSFEPLADRSFAHSPSAAAISFCFHPCSFKLQARLRRSSRQSAARWCSHAS